MRLSGEELSKISKDEIIQLYIKQQDALTELQTKTADIEKETGEKSKLTETSRRENVLVMRLATKEQELQQYAAQIAHIKKSQEDIAAKSLREALLDPAVNLLFDKMRDELKETKDKLEQAQSELSAWKFTPDSQTGKKLMSRCRTLIAENQDLGRQISQGQVAQLEAELALQKQYSENLKKSQDELNDFVIQLDEEVEGMQSTIQILQQQLNDSRKELEKYKKSGRDADYEDKSRTKPGTKDSTDRDLSNANVENRKVKGEANFVKSEVGDNESDMMETQKSPDERNFENARFICKEECDFGGGNSDYDRKMQNGDPMQVDNDQLDSGFKEVGSETPTYSEHEIIDESQDSSPEMTPERDSSCNNRDEMVSREKGVKKIKVESPSHNSLSPMNDGETYAVIDNGSDDDIERTAHIVSTTDEPVLENMNENNTLLNTKAPKTPDGEFIDPSERDETLDYDESVKEEYDDNVSQTEDENIFKRDVPESAENLNVEPNTEKDTYSDKTLSEKPDIPEDNVVEDAATEGDEQGTNASDEINEGDVDKQLVRSKTPELQQQSVPVSATDTSVENLTTNAAAVAVTNVDANIESVAKTTTVSPPNMMSLADSKPELQLPPVNGPQAAISAITHPLMQPAQVPLMGDPTAYLMNPHFQHLSGASAALAQQQAILAEQALIFKTMLAQQQQQQQRQSLSVSDDKTNASTESVDATKTGEEIRTAGMNPIVTGLPFADHSAAAYLAQYKAIFAARSMFAPGPDGKTQVLAPGGLGLYPGLPLVQPPVLTQPQSNEHGTPNSAPASWPASTNVTYAPHPLMTQAFLGTSPAPGMMVYPGHNMAPQTVATHPAAAEMDKHHGSGDHRSIPNGLTSQKGQDSSETNVTKEEPQVVM